MRRADPPIRLCPGCGMPMLRKRWKGRLETTSAYRRRKSCSLRCANKLKTGIARRRQCLQCTSVLVRKRRPNGRLEILQQFKKRLFCDQECFGLWLEDPLNAIAYGAVRKNRREMSGAWNRHVRAMRREFREIRRRFTPRRPRRASPRVCFHGQPSTAVCVFCERLAPFSRDTAQEASHG